MVRSRRQKRHNAFTPRPFFISIALFTLLAFTSWIAGWSGKDQLVTSNTAIQKRADDGAGILNISSLNAADEEPECRLVRHAEDQCAFVKEHCSDEDGLFSYIQFYYCGLRHIQPIAFIIIVAWLSMLFSTIGIAASDFLCINLSTIASILGMSESLTGVTFLAFGNGSPDVFSTFAAMGSNSGSLAVGELIGAACFITAVVAGSMALVRPFRVARRSFVRDVGYFIIAGSFSLVVLADGELHVWECATMIGLYVFYVAMVVSWHWYLTQKRRRFEREFAARAQFHIPQSQELDLQEPYTDDDPIAGETRSSLSGQLAPDFEELGIPAWKDDEDEDDETRNRYLAEIRENMHVTRPTPPRRRTTVNPIRPSLVGALEFQSVLSSLQKAKNIRDDTIDLPQYSDDNIADQASHRRRASTYLNGNYQGSHTDILSRTRSVSMNDAPGTQGNAAVNPNQKSLPQLKVPRNNVYLHPENRDVQSLVESPLTMSSAASSHHSTRSPTPSQSPTRQSTDLLTVPTENFRAPNYQASPLSHNISTADVSPLSSARSLGPAVSSEDNSETSSIVAFPSFLETPTPAFPLSHVPNAIPPPAWATSGAGVEGLAEGASPETTIHKSIPRRFLPPLQLVLATLFPTLCNWRAKTVFDKVLGVVAAPSVFFLTLTVPVIDPNRGDGESESEPSVNDEDQPRPIIRLPDDSPILHPSLPPSPASPSADYQPLNPSSRSIHEMQIAADRQRLDSEMPAVPTQTTETSSQTTSRSWYRWLTIVQAFTSPFFIVVVGWSNLDGDHDPRNLIIPILSGLLFSLVSAAALIIALRDCQLSQPPNWLRPVLSFIGFIVGICWIATIADEVVSLLKTLGVIMNISDSLLGLTVFAVGNSLGDLVADVTVARLGFPVMALSACFGGPMLNILLGIGIGGLYMSWHSTQHQHSQQALLSSATTDVVSKQPYRIVISKTLVISGVTLLVTLLGLLIIVPLNNWKMDRKIGWGLVALWVLSTLGNIIAEIVM
ncbi:Putative cation exchanger C3A12,06c [Talaromyces islandicus]|uniref:Putative cation exchanger C3A12,06c n=1 Tax=Talaromyces islandicus TaxID=28573 RepID=A0A0U1M382_TALIS|nr:Putative cation exchanger C3A12,06c [Talaromyces islandicus]